MSVILHAAILLLLAFALNAPAPRAPREATRPVAIVLAQDVARAPPAMQNVSRAATTDLDQQESEQQPLPRLGQAADFVAAELSLPQLPSSLQPAESGLLSGPNLNASGGSRIPGSFDTSAITAEQEALRRANEARGPIARLRIFGGPVAEGRSFVFLIDRSKSMGSEGLGAMRAAEEELLAALAKLEPRHQFQIVAYHHQCVYLHKRELLPATAENRERVRGFLSGLAAFGATEHEQALLAALRLEVDVIFLLTDGGDPLLNDRQVRRIARLAAGKTAIHCLHFGFGPLESSDHFLRRLAAQSNGAYRYVDMNEYSR
jgi:hypothetical protein